MISDDLQKIKPYILPPVFNYLKILENSAIKVYSFTSYGDNKGEEELATGIVRQTGIIEEGYIQIEVIANTTDPESWVGEKFFVTSNAKSNNKTLYEIFSDAGTTSTGMFVKIADI